MTRGRRFLLGCVLVGASGWTAPALARSIIDASAEDTAARSSLVADVRIDQARLLATKGSACGTTYTASVLETWKGPAKPGHILHFGFVGGLEAGRTYRVYLAADTSEQSWARFAASRASTDNGSDFARTCRSVHPAKAFVLRADRLDRAPAR